MRRIMNKFKKIAVAFTMMWAVMACDLDKLDNPNSVSPSNSDVDYVLNQVQLSFANLFFGMSDYGMQMTRLSHFYGPTYEAGFSAQSFDGFWSNAYSGVLINTKSLIPAAEEKGLYVHAGISRVLEAYTLMALVDYFGNVPYSEALDANNFNPVADDGTTIYAAAITKLDEALANFAETALAAPKNDLYYGGVKARWVTLAKTLKLRALVQTRLVADNSSAINALVTENDLIDTIAEDFNFKYSTVIANPDSRHPYFTGDYLQGSGYYKSNFLMYEMYKAKPIIDPRIRYYFYRQVNATTTDVNKLSCITQEPPAHFVDGWPFCAVGDGYWGRDFADFSGTPPDTFDRTAFGIYPAGGRFDGNFYQPVAPTMGLQGAGVLPIYNSANTYFMLAEVALTVPGANVGAAKTNLLNGIQRSVDKAKAFTTSEVPTQLVPTTTAVNNYKNYVGNLYDAATSDSQRLEIIVKEYWISLFGNGIDAFNTYRRTGKPENLQGGLISNIGKAYRSFTYPAQYVTRNANATQKPDNAVQVFWDNNPANFID